MDNSGESSRAEVASAAFSLELLSTQSQENKRRTAWCCGLLLPSVVAASGRHISAWEIPALRAPSHHRKGASHCRRPLQVCRCCRCHRQGGHDSDSGPGALLRTHGDTKFRKPAEVCRLFFSLHLCRSTNTLCSVGLPPINHLEADKVKREEAEYQRKHSAPAMVSPLHPFPLHSYSNHQSSPASSLPGPSGGLLSPPESRRTSGDEKDQRPPARQSLPSIHEALGPEPPLPYSQHPPSAPVSAPPPFFPSSSASSADARSRKFSVDHLNNQGPPNPFSQPRSPFINNPSSTAPPPASTHAPADTLARPSFPPSQSNTKLPALYPLRTTQSPVPASRANPPYTAGAYSHPPSTTHESPAPHSAGPGPMNPQYGYQHQQPTHPPNYPLSAPAPNGDGSRYPQSAGGIYSAPPQYSHPPWRPDHPEFPRAEDKKRSIGEKVKRQLDSFDLEVSLNEVRLAYSPHLCSPNMTRWPTAPVEWQNLSGITGQKHTKITALE